VARAVDDDLGIADRTGVAPYFNPYGRVLRCRGHGANQDEEPKANGTHFIKLTGPAKTIAANQHKFEQLLASVQPDR
jgi:hypothetical protein